MSKRSRAIKKAVNRRADNRKRPNPAFGQKLSVDFIVDATADMAVKASMAGMTVTQKLAVVTFMPVIRSLLSSLSESELEKRLPDITITIGPFDHNVEFKRPEGVHQSDEQPDF
jgi:hypothetical protein